MAMEENSVFPKAPALLKPHYQIFLVSYTGHSSYPYADMSTGLEMEMRHKWPDFSLLYTNKKSYGRWKPKEDKILIQNEKCWKSQISKFFQQSNEVK